MERHQRRRDSEESVDQDKLLTSSFIDEFSKTPDKEKDHKHVRDSSIEAQSSINLDLD